jgi:hypothetical protein
MIEVTVARGDFRDGAFGRALKSTQDAPHARISAGILSSHYSDRAAGVPEVPAEPDAAVEA